LCCWRQAPSDPRADPAPLLGLCISARPPNLNTTQSDREISRHRRRVAVLLAPGAERPPRRPSPLLGLCISAPPPNINTTQSDREISRHRRRVAVLLAPGAERPPRRPSPLLGLCISAPFYLQHHSVRLRNTSPSPARCCAAGARRHVSPAPTQPPS